MQFFILPFDAFVAYRKISCYLQICITVSNNCFCVSRPNAVNDNELEDSGNLDIFEQEIKNVNRWVTSKCFSLFTVSLV